MHQSDPAVAPGTTPAPSDSPAQIVGAVVSLNGVGVHFGDVVALRDLTFDVPAEQITVLLGPNGAGKTTAIRAITGALVPDSGTVRTFGLDPEVEGHRVRPRCGVVSAKPALYDRLSGRDNLVYAGELYGVTGDLSDRIDEAAERFGIQAALAQLVGGYSTGMKTRLALARSILADPDLLLFDEPTSGLDPESAHAVLDLIREMTHDGRSVVMCTHLLSEAEGLADHIVMMEAGTALVEGTPGELTRRYWPNPVLQLGAEDDRLLDRVAAWPGVRSYRRDASGAHLELDDIARIPDMVASLCSDGVRLTRVDPHQPTLEDLYFTIRRAGTASATADDPPSGLAPVAAPPSAVQPDEHDPLARSATLEGSDR